MVRVFISHSVTWWSHFVLKVNDANSQGHPKHSHECRSTISKSFEEAELIWLVATRLKPNAPFYGLAAIQTTLTTIVTHGSPPEILTGSNLFEIIWIHCTTSFISLGIVGKAADKPPKFWTICVSPGTIGESAKCFFLVKTFNNSVRLSGTRAQENSRVMSKTNTSHYRSKMSIPWQTWQFSKFSKGHSQPQHISPPGLKLVNLNN